MKSVRIVVALAIASLATGLLVANDKPASTEKPACCAEAEKNHKVCEKHGKACCIEAQKAGKECEHCKKK